MLDSGAFVAALEHHRKTSLGCGNPTRFFELAVILLGAIQNELLMVGDDLINDIGGANQMECTQFWYKQEVPKVLVEASSIRPQGYIPSIKELPAYLKNIII